MVDHLISVIHSAEKISLGLTSLMRSFIYSLAFFAIYGYITNSQNDQLPVDFIVQLVEHRTGIAEVIGSNPVQA